MVQDDVNETKDEADRIRAEAEEADRALALRLSKGDDAGEQPHSGGGRWDTVRSHVLPSHNGTDGGGGGVMDSMGSMGSMGGNTHGSHSSHRTPPNTDKDLELAMMLSQMDEGGGAANGGGIGGGNGGNGGNGGSGGSGGGRPTRRPLPPQPQTVPLTRTPSGRPLPPLPPSASHGYYDVPLATAVHPHSNVPVIDL